MSSEIRRGIAVVTYNRGGFLPTIIQAIKETAPENCKIVVCDDGSTDGTSADQTTYIRGTRQGVGANKNRALFALQNCHFLAILEDDLLPTEKGWFEIYEEVAKYCDIHHFCRVQDKEVDETLPDFSTFLKGNLGYTPVYGPTPRGDFTFITSLVLREVGGIHPGFKGVGHAHGQWSERIAESGLCGHPLKWMDIKEARDKFKQVGDTEGGRWNDDPEKVKEQIKRNAALRRELGTEPLHVPLTLP